MPRPPQGSIEVVTAAPGGLRRQGKVGSLKGPGRIPLRGMLTCAGWKVPGRVDYSSCKYLLDIYHIPGFVLGSR